MAITISIALQKGGTGKSTTAQCLANTLGFKHKKTLLIDMDSQRNTTYSMGINNPELTITDVLGDECKARDAIVNCKYCDVLPADRYLTNVEKAQVPATLLKDSIQDIQEEYDYIIIDTPPALGNLAFCSLVASDYVIIPTEPSIFSLQGIGDLADTIRAVKEKYNPNLSVLGILLIKYHNRTILNRDIRDMIEEVSQQLNTRLFKTTIRESVAVRESQTMQTPLIDYSRKSNPNIDYTDFTTEILTILEG